MLGGADEGRSCPGSYSPGRHDSSDRRGPSTPVVCGTDVLSAVSVPRLPEDQSRVTPRGFLGSPWLRHNIATPQCPWQQCLDHGLLYEDTLCSVAADARGSRQRTTTFFLALKSLNSSQKAVILLQRHWA